MVLYKTRRERLRLATADFLTSTQLQEWRATKEGQRAGPAKELQPSLEQICHAIHLSQTTIYGLLIAPQFFSIVSMFNRQSFARQSTRYREATRDGLCFLVGWHNIALLCAN